MGAGVESPTPIPLGENMSVLGNVPKKFLKLFLLSTDVSKLTCGG
jgi:hypothetical protein